MRKSLLAGAVLAAVSLIAPSAHADDAVAVVRGSGGISPGLSMTPTAQVVTFCGEGTVAVGNHAGTYNFCFNGSDPGGTTLAGSGSGTLSGDITGNVSFDRDGNVVEVTGNVSYDGENGSIDIAICVFQPTSVNPTTSYNLYCDVRLTH